MLNSRLKDKKTNLTSFWNWGPLLFSGFYLLPSIFQIESTDFMQMFTIVLLYLIFIYLYVKATQRGTEQVWLQLMSLILVCVIASYLTVGSATLFGFVAYIVGYNFSNRARIFAISILLLALLSSSQIINENYAEYFLSGSLILLVALFSYGIAGRNEFFHKRREVQNSKQLEQFAAIAERERIARDLHDVLGHSLSSIALKAELASKLSQANRQAQARSEIFQVAELARELLSDVRKVVTDLKELDIDTQINRLIVRLEESGFKVIRNIKVVDLPAKLEGVVNLIIKEAVTNILRHSSAKYCEISILQTLDSVDIKMKNNANETSQVTLGNGLSGIKERALQLGGKAEFSFCNQQFVAFIKLPLSIKSEQAE